MNKPPKLLPLLCAFMVSVLLVACAQSEVSEYNSEISEGDGETVPITELIEETAPDIETLGRYTLDDCMSQGGMYTLHLKKADLRRKKLPKRTQKQRVPQGLQYTLFCLSHLFVSR